jgi:hypothetical protein
MTKIIYGYFDNPAEETPVYDPTLDVDCPVCFKKLSLPVKTISLMLVGDSRSYFYRTHKACYDGLSPDEKTKLDSMLIDAIANTKNAN